jgi:hypothetical protein
LRRADPFVGGLLIGLVLGLLGWLLIWFGIGLWLLL